MRSCSTTPGSIDARDSRTICSMSAAVTSRSRGSPSYGSSVVPTSSAPSQGFANCTRPPSSGVVSAAAHGSSRRTIRCAPLAKRSERGAAGSAMRRSSSTHGPGRVDDAGRLDRRGRRRRARPCTRRPATRPPCQPQRAHLDARRDARAGARGGARDGDRHARVVGLVVDVAAGRAQTRRCAAAARARGRRAAAAGSRRRRRSARGRRRARARRAASRPGPARRGRPGRGTRAAARGAGRRRARARAARHAPRARGRCRPSAGSAARRG